VTAIVRSAIGSDARWDIPIGFFAFMTKYLDDLLFLLGAALICTGTFIVCPVATWFVAGGFCILGGILYGMSQRGKT
jgi:uncharacterized membrane protein SirB2